MTKGGQREATQAEQTKTTRSITSERAGAKTFSFSRDPWIMVGQSGDLYKLDTLRFTIFEMDNGVTQYSLSWNATSLGWSSNYAQGGGVTVSLELTDAGGGVLDNWNLGYKDFPCAGGPQSYLNTGGKPGTYEVCTGAILTLGAANWGHC